MTEYTAAEQAEIDLAFPAIPCPIRPLGNRVLVQMRLPKTRTASGLLLTDDTSDNMLRNEQTARVVHIGGGAFRFATGDAWPEGRTFAEGDFVRVPLYGGDNHWIPDPGDSNRLILFKTFKDYEVSAIIAGNPLDVKTNLAYL
jgi:co-chaperonin GroES (HSP10)